MKSPAGRGFVDPTPLWFDPFPMPSARERMCVMAQIGKIKFWATEAPHGGERRIAEYPTIGGEGADTEDFGADARPHTIKAVLDEDVYLALYNLMDEGEVQDVVHPLFGVMRARIKSVRGVPPLKEQIDTTIIVIEHGLRWTNPSPLTLAGAAGRARGIMDPDDPFYEGLNDMPDTLDMPDALGGAMGGVVTSWSDFDAVLTSAQQGVAIWEEVASAYGGLAESCNDLVSAYEDAVDTITSLPESAASAVRDVMDSVVYDTTYELLDAGRDCVDAAQAATTTVWRSWKAMGPVTLAELATEYLGANTQANIQKILDANPTVIDVNVVRAGTELRLPV